MDADSITAAAVAATNGSGKLTPTRNSALVEKDESSIPLLPSDGVTLHPPSDEWDRDRLSVAGLSNRNSFSSEITLPGTVLAGTRDSPINHADLLREGEDKIAHNFERAQALSDWRLSLGEDSHDQTERRHFTGYMLLGMRCRWSSSTKLRGITAGEIVKAPISSRRYRGHVEALDLPFPDCGNEDLDAHGKRKGRNLVICIDGTSNKFGTTNTNVIELYSQILKEKPNKQLTYYDSGIGTYATPSWKSWSYLKQVMDNKVDLMIAWNLEKVIIGAYRWLSNQYREGDKIFLFGFSRGAFQVRALAGMIETVRTNLTV
ncbi:hypothetical protein FIBSPDRAFT_969696 [Athelia psychrophila]|uniref:T6SS Phospholipase effector Tle1-like catalytic domain-containing protein n=1 Tax=Athelia psychrophila TaxID=1759441 RepID=A0A167T9H5_9AGAM|nr:hypothetical protein FIBSPDRAFT_969696 [Fibularhizoctonia sp. CBS 109695]